MPNSKIHRIMKKATVASFSVAALLLFFNGNVNADSTVTNSGGSYPQSTVSVQGLKAAYSPSYNNDLSQSVTSNQGYYDLITYSNGSVNARGWNDVEFNNLSVENNYHRYLLLVNSRTGQTISAANIDNSSLPRPDVARVYPHNVNAAQSGFNASLNVNWNLTGWNDPLQVVSRYSLVNYSNGDGGQNSYVDFRSNSFTLSQLNRVIALNNYGWLDSANYSNGQLTVTGWNAVQYNNETNTAGLHHYLIIFDRTTNRQLASVDITGQKIVRPDVARIYPNAFDSIESGFSHSFNINSSAWLTDQLALVSRYSLVSTGNGDNGNGSSHVDFWLNIARPDWRNVSYLDQAALSGNQLIVSGWHATTQSYFEPYHFLIIFDDTTGRQVGSYMINSSVDRPDVAKVYPGIYNSARSGFIANLNLGADRSWTTDRLSLISRYSRYNVGNGDVGRGGYTDYWSKPFWLM